MKASTRMAVIKKIIIQVLLWTWTHWNPRTLLVGTQNSAVTLENSLAIPQKVTWSYHRTQQFQISLLDIYSKIGKHMNVHNSIMHNGQKGEITRYPSTNEEINMLYPYNQIVFSNEKK